MENQDVTSDMNCKQEEKCQHQAISEYLKSVKEHEALTKLLKELSPRQCYALLPYIKRKEDGVCCNHVYNVLAWNT